MRRKKLIKKIFKKAFNSMLFTNIEPPPEDSLAELEEVMHQHSNRKNKASMQKDLDLNPPELFNKIVKDGGYECDIKHIKYIGRAIEPIIMFHKSIYKRKRPSAYAKEIGVDWSGDDDKMSTVSTPSYPSGHACQGYYRAYIMSDKYPDLKDKFINLAEAISQSRIDRGVHYPSDIEGGKELAVKLYENRKKNKS